MNRTYVLAGTYKTRPESEGWYIAKKYDIVWEKINLRFNCNYREKDCHYNPNESIFGKVGTLDNFFFYDLKPYDESLENTKDEEVFQKNREDFIKGIENLIKVIKSHSDTTFRVGLQSRNLFGLFYNYFNNFNRLKTDSLKKMARKCRSKYEGRIDINHRINNLDLWKIYNATQMLASRNSDDYESWDYFLDLK
jgi:hypothetical protein